MLCCLCHKLHQAGLYKPSTASKLHWTWSQFKYYHSSLTQKCGPKTCVTSSVRKHLLRPWIALEVAACCTSTDSLQTVKWEKPEGYNTKIMIYHPLVKEKVPLILRKEKLVQWYACGPTVYDSAHIGHASSYVRLDIIRRILSSVFNIDTFLVMGVTDIDDKIINKSNETGQTLNEVSRLYESDFFTSMAKLNVLPPSVTTRVTDHIPHVIHFISGIEKKGLTYTTSAGSVYFDIQKYGKYGMFSGSRESGTSEIDPEKKASSDFALWKGSKPGEPFWQSPWGAGRPGWHIECSAMASDIFGTNFDLHTGGEDLIFPHHENELAQSCAYHGNSQWVNYWLHTGHLFLSGQNDKMSKSLKNVITVPEFLQNYTPNEFRMLCLLNSYRNRIEFGPEQMEKAVSTLNSLNSIITRCDSYVRGQINCAAIPEAELYEKIHSTRETVQAAFADDFNTPKALANLIRLVKFTNQLLMKEIADTTNKVDLRSNAPVAAVSAFIQRVLDQLGLDVGKRKADQSTDFQFRRAVDTFVAARSQIRTFTKDKQFMIKTADEVGIPEDKASKLMKKLYMPLWSVTDQMRADILANADVQINDDRSHSTWTINTSKSKTSSKDPKSPDQAHGQENKQQNLQPNKKDSGSQARAANQENKQQKKPKAKHAKKSRNKKIPS